MKVFHQGTFGHMAFAVGSVLTLLVGFGSRDARAQAPVASTPATAGAGWYSYVPGRGWVNYAPSSTTAVTSVAPSAAGTAAVAQPGTAEPGWYGYIPGRGWVRYATAPASPVASNASRTSGTTSPAPSGWAGYSPATGWTGYAPASSSTYPNPAVKPSRRTSSSTSDRQRAAHQAVHRIAPELSHAIPAYREYGSGRSVPLAKPWLPSSP